MSHLNHDKHITISKYFRQPDPKILSLRERKKNQNRFHTFHSKSL